MICLYGSIACIGEVICTFFWGEVGADIAGIPVKSREDVFRPFFRLDFARNQEETGTGLGHAIARTSPAHMAATSGWKIALGGLRLRAVVEIPV